LAPIGAIGIMILGERVLDREEQSSYLFNELRERLGLPRVGERLRNNDLDTVWKVIEEKEAWIEVTTKAGEEKVFPRLLPATGKTLTCRYSQMDTPFDNNWEILYDW